MARNCLQCTRRLTRRFGPGSERNCSSVAGGPRSSFFDPSLGSSKPNGAGADEGKSPAQRYPLEVHRESRCLFPFPADDGTTGIKKLSLLAANSENTNQLKPVLRLAGEGWSKWVISKQLLLHSFADEQVQVANCLLNMYSPPGLIEYVMLVIERSVNPFGLRAIPSG